MPGTLGFDMSTASARLRRLTMTELRALAALKSAGNLSAAARALDVTQPTLSQHLRAIEDKLELRLFDRHRRGVDPTPAGTAMLRLASAMQLDFVRAAEELSIAARADTRPIRIGSMPITSGGLLAVTLGQFASIEANQVPSVVVEGPREVLLEHLRHNRIDLFVGRLPGEAECEGFERELLFLDTALVIGSARHALAERKKVALSSLDRYRWVLPSEETTFFKQIEQTLRNAGHAMPAGTVQSYSMHAIPAIVACSELLGFLPRSLFAAGTMTHTLRRINVDLQWVPAPVGVLVRSEVSADERLVPLLRTLRAVAASARVSGAVS
jgi:DNA-binding transcriptional LysR family regulator